MAFSAPLPRTMIILCIHGQVRAVVAGSRRRQCESCSSPHTGHLRPTYLIEVDPSLALRFRHLTLAERSTGSLFSPLLRGRTAEGERRGHLGLGLDVYYLLLSRQVGSQAAR